MNRYERREERGERRKRSKKGKSQGGREEGYCVYSANARWCCLRSGGLLFTRACSYTAIEVRCQMFISSCFFYFSLFLFFTSACLLLLCLYHVSYYVVNLLDFILGRRDGGEGEGGMEGYLCVLCVWLQVTDLRVEI
jgi:hypothetical protein